MKSTTRPGYDLVLNTDHLKAGVAARLIITGLLENLNALRPAEPGSAVSPPATG